MALQQAVSWDAPPFPTTRHLMVLVAYAAGVFAALAYFGRRINAPEFWLLATLLVLMVPNVITSVIWLVERPGARRTRHLVLSLILARISFAVLLAAATVAVWVYTWSDLSFFMRIEGRHWLVFWIVAPLWCVCAARFLVTLAERRAGIGGACRQAPIDRRRKELVMMTLVAIVAVAYRELVPVLLDRDLVNLTRLLATVALATILYRLAPGRCPACGHRSLITLPDRPPFVPLKTTSKPSRCLTCWVGL
jgi:hypothetical protein